MKLTLATGNKDKIEEIRSFFRESIEIISLPPQSEETGATLRENALQKAREAATRSGGWALADDTGLKVAALNGAPGVYSARYAGPGATYEENRKKLLADLKGVEEVRRGAHFSCVLALCHADGREVVVEGRLEGVVINEERGSGGFGYDPVFWLSDRRCTLAELSLEEKNKISHRGKALS